MNLNNNNKMYVMLQWSLFKRRKLLQEINIYVKLSRFFVAFLEAESTY